MMFGYYGGHMGAWGWLGAVLGSVAFWAVIVGLIALVVRSARGEPADLRPRHPDPVRTLAERFARGEIDEQEYRQRLGVLRDQGY